MSDCDNPNDPTFNNPDSKLQLASANDVKTISSPTNKGNILSQVGFAFASLGNDIVKALNSIGRKK